MRNNLTETEQIEKYLFDHLSDAEKLQFETRRLADADLYEKTEMQKQVHKIIRIFSRRQQRNKLESIYQQLLQEPSFTQQLKTIFA